MGTILVSQRSFEALKILVQRSIFVFGSFPDAEESSKLRRFLAEDSKILWENLIIFWTKLSLTLFRSGGYQIDTCLLFSLFLRHGFSSESEQTYRNRVKKQKYVVF